MVFLHISDCISPPIMLRLLRNARYVVFEHDVCARSNRTSIKNTVPAAAVQVNTQEIHKPSRDACSPCLGHNIQYRNEQHTDPHWSHKAASLKIYSQDNYVPVCMLFSICATDSALQLLITTVIRNSSPLADPGQFKHQNLSRQSPSER